MSSNQRSASFAAIVTVFFFWGFLAASNGIFIPFCRSHFHLSQFQSQLVDFAFYGAYFMGSLLLYMFSLHLNKDIINVIGYKRTIINGLALSVAGGLIMIPAVYSGSFAFILCAFFIIALGFSLQQTSANPLILNIGDPAKGSHRLNFAGSINSFGTTLGPIIVSVILFGKAVATEKDAKEASLSSVNVLYIILVAALGIAAMVVYFTKIPRLAVEEKTAGIKVLKGPLFIILYTLVILVLVFLFLGFKAENTNGEFWFLIVGALFLGVLGIILYLQFLKMRREDRVEQGAYPQVTWGMLAIFIYVGVEVTIQSNLGALLKLPEYGGLVESEIAPYISIYWGSLMIGRWTGSIGAFKIGDGLKTVLTIILPFCGLLLVLFMNHLNGTPFLQFIDYSVCLCFLILAFFLGKQKPAATLIVFSLLGVLAMVVGMLTTGKLSAYSFLTGGLFCSIMWPCIFSLATAGLGKYTGQASSFLIMMILGGALIPPFQGMLADKIDIHFSYIITIFCFAFLVYYGLKVKGILKRAGIDYDQAISETH